MLLFQYLPFVMWGSHTESAIEIIRKARLIFPTGGSFSHMGDQFQNLRNEAKAGGPKWAFAYRKGILDKDKHVRYFSMLCLNDVHALQTVDTKAYFRLFPAESDPTVQLLIISMAQLRTPWSHAQFHRLLPLDESRKIERLVFYYDGYDEKWMISEVRSRHMDPFVLKILWRYTSRHPRAKMLSALNSLLKN